MNSNQPIEQFVNQTAKTLVEIATEEHQKLYELIKLIENRKPRIKPLKSFALINIEELIIDDDIAYEELKDTTGKEIVVFSGIHKHLGS